MIMNANAYRLVGFMLLTAATGAARAQENPPTQYRVCELRFEARTLPANPWTDVRLTADVRGPADRRIVLRGFYDGGNIWKIRFTPTAPGRWTYRTACDRADAGLDGREGTIDAAPAAGDTPLRRHGGILATAPDGRHLAHTDGTPFFWLGDTWWFCPSDLVPIDRSNRPECPSTFKRLLDTRKRQGFSVVQIAFLGPMAPAKGVTDFIAARQSGAFDPAYWQQTDRYVDAANEAGIALAIGVGFHKGLDAHALDDWRFLWDYLVARYGAHAVTWLVCGEYNLDTPESRPSGPRVEKALALGRAIRQADPYRRAMTIHPWWFGGDKRQAWAEPWYDFIMIQGGHPGHGRSRAFSDYWKICRDQRKPLLEAECNYESIYNGNKAKQVTAEDVRRTAYTAIQGGSFGYTYGSHGLWYPTQGPEDRTHADWGDPIPWWESVAQPGAAQMGHLRKAYESVDWWRLAPWPEGIAVEPGVKIAARPMAKGAVEPLHAVVYFPPGFPAGAAVTLTLPKPADLVCPADWFDPRAGARSPIAGGLAVKAGAATLPPRPDGEDWVLLLREAAEEMNR
jgi:hypothetical protein